MKPADENGSRIILPMEVLGVGKKDICYCR
jgi:hypothetical protein